MRDGQLGERLGAPRRDDALLGGVGRQLAAADGARVVAGAAAGGAVALPRPGGAQHLGHRAAQILGADARRRLHGREREHQQQMALDHVDQRAGLVVVAGAALEPERLLDDDLDVLDVLGREQRLEDPVREPQPDQVEDRRLAEEVVDPEHLLLGHHRLQQPVERAGAARVVAERLLEREHDARRQRHLRERRARPHRDRRREGEVHGGTTGGCGEHGREIVGTGGVGLQIEGLARHALPQIGTEGRECRAHPRAPGGIRHLAPVDADQLQLLAARRGEQRRQPGEQQPRRQVAAGTQDHQGVDARIRHAARLSRRLDAMTATESVWDYPRPPASSRATSGSSSGSEARWSPTPATRCGCSRPAIRRCTTSRARRSPTERSNPRGRQLLRVQGRRRDTSACAAARPGRARRLVLPDPEPGVRGARRPGRRLRRADGFVRGRRRGGHTAGGRLLRRLDHLARGRPVQGRHPATRGW